MKPFKKKSWLKSVSRCMAAYMLWFLTVPPVMAETVPTAWLVEETRYTHADLLIVQRPGIHPGTVPIPSETLDRLKTAHPGFLQQNRAQEAPKAGAGYNILTEIGHAGGFIVTFSVVLAGYLALYIPVGSYAGTVCMFDEESWNDCWNDYMNKTFH